MYKKYGKRALDLFISILSLIAVIPLGAIITIIIKLDSKGKIFFLHKRCGLEGRPFYAIKFRTMVSNASEIGPSYTSPGDSRVTRVGRYLRRFSLDELPQIINIIKGEMSLVGPRPPAYSDDLEKEELERLMVKPGLTGLSQVNGRSLLTTAEKLRYDLTYVNEYSFNMDMQIIIKTVKVVLLGTGVNSSIKTVDYKASNK